MNSLIFFLSVFCFFVFCFFFVLFTCNKKFSAKNDVLIIIRFFEYAKYAVYAMIMRPKMLAMNKKLSSNERCFVLPNAASVVKKPITSSICPPSNVLEKIISAAPITKKIDAANP